MALHFSDACKIKCVLVAECVDSLEDGKAGGDQLVAAVVFKDVCANFLSILKGQCGRPEGRSLKMRLS